MSEPLDSFADVSKSQLDAFVSQIYKEDEVMLESVLADSQMHSEMMVLTTESTGLHPCVEKWDGPHGFSAFVASDVTSKSPWFYSTQLSKVFIPINSVLPVHFKCVWPGTNLLVRALPVFLEANEIPKPVLRCSYHLRDSKEETDTDFPYPNHVVRCENLDSLYVEDPVSRRVSVLTPLGSPPPGADHVVLHYKFTCKTSCIGGMNRRPMQVIFTLERNTGEVVGRTVLKIRICSCPRRDMRKEEETATKASDVQPPCKRLATVAPRPSGKLKTPKFEPGTYDHFIPLVGGNDYLISCARLLRAHTVGEKLATGKELTLKEQCNLDIFNQIIGDVPDEGEESDQAFSS